MSSKYRRRPTPTETRLILRHHYQFYTNLVIGCIYQFPPSLPLEQLVSLSLYLPALKKCLDQHPFLSAVVVRADGKETAFTIADTVDLSNHFRLHKRPEVASTEDIQIGNMIEKLSNTSDLTFFDTIFDGPGWRLDVLPLADCDGRHRVWIGFTYSHCNGDGRSGIIFQESFFAALSESLRSSSKDIDPIYKPREVELKALPKLSVSAIYLLGPALGHYLPKFMSRWFGLKASTSGSDDGTWTGSLTFLNDPEATPKATTAVEVYTIGSVLLAKVLQACRAHDAKLTSLLNVLIAHSLSRNLPNFTELGQDKDNLIASVPTNLRAAANVPDKTIGNFSSAAFTRYAVDRTLTNECEAVVTSSMWSDASWNSKDLFKKTSTLNDQPIGLLSWISNLDSWMKEQIGKERDSSWQLSNLMTFDGRLRQPTSDAIRVEKVYFSQPADAIGSPLAFNTVSLAGGDLVICVSWQVGAIGLTGKRGPNTDGMEREFVSRLLSNLTAYLEAAAR